MFGTATAGLPLTASDLCAITTDRLEQALTDAQGAVDGARAVQLAVTAELDRRQVNTADGYRTMGEWVATKLDEAPEAARTLVQTARTITPEIGEALGSGEMGYARAVETTRLAVSGAEDPIAVSWKHDIAGLRRRAAAQTRITPQIEQDAHDGRYLHVQPNLEETAYKLWGHLAGFEGRVVIEALDDRVDRFPTEIGTVTQRRADALVSIAQDSLAGQTDAGNASAAPMVTMFVDTDDAVPSNGERGLVLEGGPRVGRQTLEAILCDAIVEVIATDEAGRVIDLGRKRTLPPAIRRTVIARDGGHCVIAGCDSRHRVEVHHLIPQAHGGDHSLDNLATLCWFHHHVAIHRNGMSIQPDSPRFARRLIRPPSTGPPI